MFNQNSEKMTDYRIVSRAIRALDLLFYNYGPDFLDAVKQKDSHFYSKFQRHVADGLDTRMALWAALHDYSECHPTRLWLIECAAVFCAREPDGIREFPDRMYNS